ncbi:MAG TPA: hypothetical protein VEV13_05425 [Candidatus Limnocylindria bacterium]|nr:hypothetical protein [Candidatus Limnocylindria bacterium]
MSPSRVCAVLAVPLASALLLVGCSDATDPVKAEASVVTGGLSAGNGVEALAALTTVSTVVKGWELENGRLPTAAEFATIPGATTSGGATLTYAATATGFCLTATSAGPPVVVRVWIDPGGLQPVGASC